MITSRFRLTSDTAYKRTSNEDKNEAKKVFFLSVEGFCTEKDYFTHLDSLTDNHIVHVEVLNRDMFSGHSSPEQVLALLDECVELRTSSVIPYDSLADWFLEKHEESLSKLKDDKEFVVGEEFVSDLLKLNIDYHYRSYLKNYNGEHDSFGILIDRDRHSRSHDSIMSCIDYCHNKGYEFYITNPCFDFWLLLHVSSKEEIEHNIEQIKENKKISQKHTFVSNLLSTHTHSGSKSISKVFFTKTYMPFIQQAVELSKSFETDEVQIVNNIGTNIPQLLHKLELI